MDLSVKRKKNDKKFFKWYLTPQVDTIRQLKISFVYNNWNLNYNNCIELQKLKKPSHKNQDHATLSKRKLTPLIAKWLT